jgi:hypothetical protein
MISTIQKEIGSKWVGKGPKLNKCVSKTILRFLSQSIKGTKIPKLDEK